MFKDEPVPPRALRTSEFRSRKSGSGFSVPRNARKPFKF